MNQMNLMNLLRALYDEKIFFSIIGCLLAGIWYMQVHPAGVMAVFGWFFNIFFILVVTSMKQMYLDEPISVFKRFFALVNLPDEPLTNANLHRGSFGSLRTEIYMSVLTIFRRKKALPSPPVCHCGRDRRLCVRWMQGDWVIRNDLPCRFPVGNEQFEKMVRQGRLRVSQGEFGTLIVWSMWIVVFLLVLTMGIVIRYFVFGGIS